MSTEIERLLAEMPLRRPTTSLDGRVLCRRGKARVLRWSAVGAAVAAAAAVVTIAVAPWRGGPQERPGPVERAHLATQTPAAEMVPAGPVRLERDFSQLHYEGIMLLDENTPVHRFRRRIFRNVLWVDERSGFAEQMAIPDQEIIFISAESH